MELRDFINLAEKPPKLRYLVIGGYAVAAHGHTRATFDVDFLARRADQELWFARGKEAGLGLYAKSNAFAQFSSKDGGESFDLMFVEEKTFEEMWGRLTLKRLGDLELRVPSLEHLLALKLHVLKQGLPHRTAKDANDVEMLIRRNQLDLALPETKALFLKYGNQEIYETFLRILRHS